MARFDDKREEMTQDLFGTHVTLPRTGQGVSGVSGLRAMFVKLERLKKQELSRWWDGITLQQYIDNKKTPRGLGILIFPTFEDLSDELLKEWEANLEGASLTMMQILIRHAIEKGAKLLSEIEVVEKEIETCESKDLVDKNYEIPKKVIEGHQNYLKKKKLRKIKKDDKDYREGRIYTFAKKFDSITINEDRKRLRE